MKSNLWAAGLGLALLYVSGFFLPIVGNYYFPFEASQILYPTVVATLALLPVGIWCQERYGTSSSWDLLGLIVISLLCWIAVVSAFSAAGYSAFGIAVLFANSQTILTETRWMRVAMVASILFALVWAVHAMRRHWREVLRILSILGYLYALLALSRVDYGSRQLAPQYEEKTTGQRTASQTLAQDLGSSNVAQAQSRRVIWIILDELDYNKTLRDPAATGHTMPNLERLASMGVSASNAYSPAKDTVASIPALITGLQLTGLNINGSVMTLRTQGTHGPENREFNERNSIFARLPEGPNSAAILGFYHPYCALFPSVKTCVASPEANVGRWFDGLTYFSQTAIDTARSIPGVGDELPAKLFQLFEPWYRISEETIQEFPSFLSLHGKSLIYVHVNLPHLPGDYSQKLFHLRTAHNDAEIYRRNLRLADHLIGEAIASLTSNSEPQDTFLIVSSDHWQRSESPLEPQRIPWVAWHVGETDGVGISSKISTGHTADFVLSFLRGQIDQQSDIVRWWEQQTFHQTLMPKGFKY